LGAGAAFTGDALADGCGGSMRSSFSMAARTRNAERGRPSLLAHLSILVRMSDGILDMTGRRLSAPRRGDVLGFSMCVLLARRAEALPNAWTFGIRGRAALLKKKGNRRICRLPCQSTVVRRQGGKEGRQEADAGGAAGHDSQRQPYGYAGSDTDQA
jgi:hypothetical protein